MTFLDKLKEDYPKLNAKKISNSCCPSSYDYEPEGDCPTGDCTSCWNREMPDTEFKQSVANPPTQEEQETWCNAHESGKAEGYEKGLNDAWELLRKLSGLKSDEFIKIYDTCILYEVIYKNTPQEALAKLKAYEEAQNKIEVGDIVKTKNGEEFVVSYIHKSRGSKGYCGMTKEGMWIGGEYDATKTGKHIDIQQILEQIGGE